MVHVFPTTVLNISTVIHIYNGDGAQVLNARRHRQSTPSTHPSLSGGLAESVTESSISDALQLLDKHLTRHSYIGGHLPTQADVRIAQSLQQLHKTNVESLTNLRRWIQHLESFSSCECGEFSSASRAEGVDTAAVEALLLVLLQRSSSVTISPLVANCDRQVRGIDSVLPLATFS